MHQNQKSNVPISINAHDLNKKLEFDIVEPRLAIKFKGDQYIYKLALSTYGINANIIEYDESKKNGNEKSLLIFTGRRGFQIF